MSRRRYISTDISTEDKLDEVSDFAALLYTWMIPHVGEDALLHGSPSRIRKLVVPGRNHPTEEVLDAMHELASAELFKWHDEAEVIEFDPDTFYRYQTNVQEARRRTAHISTEQHTTPQNSTDAHTTPQNSTDAHTTPQNSTSLSLSPSLSPSKDKVLSSTRETDAPHPVRTYFEEKLRRDATPEEIRSIVRWCRRYGDEPTKQAIGQAAVQGEAGNPRLISHILKTEATQVASA